MERVDLQGSGESLQLGSRLKLRAPGLQGYAVLHNPLPVAVRGQPELGTRALETALGNAGFVELSAVELGVAAVSGPPPAQDVRGPGDVPAFELEISDTGEEWGAALLAQDESGALSWHFPLDRSNAVVPPTRGGGSKLFRLPRQVVAPPPATEAGTTRGVLGLIGKKLLKVLVYPVTDPILGAVTEHFAGKWEAAHRPYGFRSFTPQNYTDVTTELPDWQALSSGRSLLFLHGTFSRAHAAFGGLPSETMEALSDRYGKRLFAFDHFSLAHSPAQNIRQFVEMLPADVRKLDFDIICHSRGGLVARTLAEQLGNLGTGGREINVGKVVFVATPNQGTLLANPDHMIKMIDRYTTMLNVFPVPQITDVLEGIMAVVKILGHGVLKGLDGLSAMCPDRVSLNAPGAPPCQYYAIAADFDPDEAGLGHLVRGLQLQLMEKLMDDVFQNAANDLVVPTRGVYEPNGSPNFPIPPERRFEFTKSPKVTHINIFGEPEASERLLAWLQP